MDDLGIITRADCPYNESNNVYSSFDSKHYDEIITKLRLQAIEKYQYGKLQEEERDQKSSKRILLVDDDPDTCIVYQIVLEDAGYECKSYTDSVKASKEFRPNYYDLILLDIKMPVLNGFELCKQIREVDKTVQIIFITASEGYYEQLRTQSYPELANDTNIKYVQKPIANDDLVQLVNTLISINHKNK